MKPLLLLPALAIVAALLAHRPAHAKPSWAAAGDTSDERGHVFVCEGSARSEDDALAAALANCNDRICKLCGVEVESRLEVREDLQGVELQRKVVERCRLVRKKELKPRYRSVECGPDGCLAWIQIPWSREDERAECPAYASEKFADPAACEKDIDEFRNAPGWRGAAQHRRAQLLQAALEHCADIDVRPTPALTALDEKLRQGLLGIAKDDDGKPAPFRATISLFLQQSTPPLQAMAESKLLVERIRLAHEYVRNRALVMDVVDALEAPDWDTPEGFARVMAAMRAAPLHAHYGAIPVQFAYAEQFERSKTDRGAWGAFVRATYKPEDVVHDNRVASYFRADGRVTAEEWAYTRAMVGDRCDECLRMLLAVPAHDPAGSRVARFVELLEAKSEHVDTFEAADTVFAKFAPLSDPVFVLAAEPKVPPAYGPVYALDLFDALLERVDFPPVRPEGKTLAKRIADALLRAPADERWCRDLVQRGEMFARYGVSDRPFDKRVCECLEGPLANETVADNHKSALYSRALARELPCVR